MTASRFVAQGLTGRKAGSVREVVHRLLAVQSQELRAARLGIRARSVCLVAADLERALVEREVVVSWLNRGTLHLALAEDYPWLHVLTTPQLVTGCERRLRQEGVSAGQADRALEVIERALEQGPRTRSELKGVLAEAGVPVAGQAIVHLLVKATLAGICVRGPLHGKEHAFVLVRQWLPQAPAVSRKDALRMLGPRYVAAHAAADEYDLATWAGVTVRDARLALADVPQPLVPADVPPPTLLGPWDELLMGWRSREWVLRGQADVVTRNGMFRPVILVNGVVAGTWGVAGGRVSLQPFGRPDRRTTQALDAEVADVQRFLADQPSGVPSGESDQT